MKELEFIREHPMYRLHYGRLVQTEEKRVFCRHDMAHFLDVARIAWILDLEQGLGIRKEIVYAAALFHDIGKWRQYEQGCPHERASAEIAEQILHQMPAEWFTKEEAAEILQAIRGHRRFRENAGSLERILFLGDKKSRQCFACPVERECRWDKEKKNLEIEI